MDIESLRRYCIKKTGTVEEMLYHDDAMAFKVMNKVYVQLWLSHWEAGKPRVNLKCDPEKAVDLRGKYPDEVHPGYHMHKKYWNTVYINLGLGDQKIFELVDHSYDQVVMRLTKKEQEELKELGSSNL